MEHAIDYLQFMLIILCGAFIVVSCFSDRAYKVVNIAAIWLFFIFLFRNGGILSPVRADFFFTLLMGIGVGHILFGISLLLTRISLVETFKYTIPLRDIFSFYGKNQRLVIKYTFVSLYEEFMWRGNVQGILGGYPFGIIITALFFTLMHKKSLAEDRWRPIEFILFSLFLGYSYYLWENLWFVLIVHTIRNGHISYRWSKKQESGEEIPCSRELSINLAQGKK